MLNLLGRLFTRNLGLILVSALLLAGFQFLMCAIVATTDISGAMQQLMAFAPPVVQMAMSSMIAAGASDHAMLAFGWNHPITHALATALPIVVGARAIAGEVENGAVELLLAQPISRALYLTTQIVFALLCILLIGTVGVLATMAGQQVFGVAPFGLPKLGLLLLSFFLLQAAIFSIALLVSTFGREGGRAALIATMIALVSYMVAAVAALWPRVAYIGNYSLHHYFDPRARLVEGRLDLLSVLVLVGAAVICCAAASSWFARRDLP